MEDERFVFLEAKLAADEGAGFCRRAWLVEIVDDVNGDARAEEMVRLLF